MEATGGEESGESEPGNQGAGSATQGCEGDEHVASPAYYAVTTSPPRTPELGTCEGTGYTWRVAIRGFQHKGLELFFTAGKTSKIQAQHAERLRLILGRLNVATEPRDMNLPGLQLHQLKGNRRGTWAVSVSGNWRVTFTFVEQDFDRVDYEDYH